MWPICRVYSFVIYDKYYALWRPIELKAAEVKK